MTGNSRWLITGATGQLGGALSRLAATQGIDVDAPGRRTLDLTDPSSITMAFNSGRWDAVINCAAYTAVDRAETEPELAEAINVRAPYLLAIETARQGIPLIHISTDYVFDGTKPAPYLETDTVCPVNVYGKTKEAGERAVRSGNPRHAIIRTAWVVSAGIGNFVDTMLKVGASRAELGVVGDQCGCPTNAEDLAEATLRITRELNNRSGTWHVVNQGEASWYDLANRIFSATHRHGLPTPHVRKLTTAQYPTAASRPANSRLSTAKIAADFGIRLRPWQEAIDAILAERLD